jgi:hypothetical protein
MVTDAERPHRRALLGLVVSVLTVSTLPAVALAHADHASHAGPTGIPLLPLAVLASGLLVLGTGLYLGTRNDVENVYADAGIALGVGGLLAASGLLVI